MRDESVSLPWLLSGLTGVGYAFPKYTNGFVLVIPRMLSNVKKRFIKKIKKGIIVRTVYFMGIKKER